MGKLSGDGNVGFITSMVQLECSWQSLHKYCACAVLRNMAIILRQPMLEKPSFDIENIAAPLASKELGIWLPNATRLIYNPNLFEYCYLVQNIKVNHLYNNI